MCISLTDLREQNFAKIEEQLCSVKDFDKVVVNAIDDCDLKVFTVALYSAINKGKNLYSAVQPVWLKSWEQSVINLCYSTMI